MSRSVDLQGIIEDQQLEARAEGDAVQDPAPALLVTGVVYRRSAPLQRPECPWP